MAKVLVTRVGGCVTVEEYSCPRCGHELASPGKPSWTLIDERGAREFHPSFESALAAATAGIQ